MILELKHIGKIDTAKFNLKQGVTIVVGANGVGKSTLVNALFLALTGDTIDGAVLEDKVTWDHETGSVTLQTDSWTVTRTIGKKSSALLTDTSGLRLTKKAEINDYIFKFYSIESSDILKEVYFAAQYRAIDILETTPAKRLDMLAAVFGLLKFIKAQKCIYQVLANMPQIEVNDDLLEDTAKRIDSYKQQLKDADKSLVDKREELSSLDSTENLIAIINSPTEKDMSDIIVKKEDCYTRLDIYTTEYKNIQAYKDESELLKSQITQYTQYTNDVNDLEKLSKDMEDLQVDMPTSTENIRKVQADTIEAKAELTAELKALTERKDLLKDGLCPLSKTPPCSGLLSLSDPESIGVQINDIKSKLSIVNEDLAALVVMEQRSSEAYKKYCEIESKIAVIKHRISTVPESVKCLQFSEEDIRKVSDYDVDKINTRLSELSEKIQETRSELATLEATLKVNNIVTEEAKIKATTDYDRRNKLESDIIATKVLIDSLKRSLEDTASVYSKLKEDKDKAEQVNFKRETLAVARQALGRDYLPRLLMENIIDRLNTHLLYYINLFNFKYKCKMLSDGNFYYLNEANEWVNTRYLSGGQKYIVALMLKLAMASTIKTNFPFYVLDEPTTGLDYQNRCLLADLFKDMEAKIKPLYLVIPTHDVEVAEVATNKIIIEKED